MTTTSTTCRKCNGSGFIPRFASTDEGVCYDCDGTGLVTVAYTVKPSSYSQAVDLGLAGWLEATDEALQAALDIINERTRTTGKRGPDATTASTHIVDELFARSERARRERLAASRARRAERGE